MLFDNYAFYILFLCFILTFAPNPAAQSKLKRSIFLEIEACTIDFD